MRHRIVRPIPLQHLVQSIFDNHVGARGAGGHVCPTDDLVEPFDVAVDGERLEQRLRQAADLGFHRCARVMGNQVADQWRESLTGQERCTVYRVQAGARVCIPDVMQGSCHCQVAAITVGDQMRDRCCLPPNGQRVLLSVVGQPGQETRYHSNREGRGGCTDYVLHIASVFVSHGCQCKRCLVSSEASWGRDPATCVRVERVVPTMCRAIHDSCGGRRCERDQYGAEMDRIMQVFNRHARGLVSAECSGNAAAAERHANLMSVAADRETTLAESKTRAAKGATKAPAFTVESTADLTDKQLRAAARTNAGDPDCVDAIHKVLDWRDQQDGEIADAIGNGKRYQREWGVVPSWEVSQDPAENLSRSPIRRLTPEQQCREEYSLYCNSQFLAAEYECAGNLLNARGKAKDVDPTTLFSGPAARAAAYGSEELRGWFRDHGRQTYGSFRYAYFGRDSDYVASKYAARQDFGDVA